MKRRNGRTPVRRARQGGGENRGVEVRMDHIWPEPIDECTKPSSRAHVSDGIHAPRERNRVNRGPSGFLSCKRLQAVGVRTRKVHRRACEMDFGAVRAQRVAEFAEKCLVADNIRHDEEQTHNHMARAEDFSRVWLTGISSSSPCLSCLKHEHVPQFLLGFFAGVFGPFFGGLAWRDPFAIRRRFLNYSRKDLSATTLRKWCMRSTPRGGREIDSQGEV